VHFTGELDLLNDRPTLVNCRAVRNSRVLRISRESVRKLMRTELDIAELILTEWIIRRARLVIIGKGGIIVVGDSHAAETMRIERFLIGNGHPHQLIDSNSNLEAEVLLRALDVDQTSCRWYFSLTARPSVNLQIQCWPTSWGSIRIWASIRIMTLWSWVVAPLDLPQPCTALRRADDTGDRGNSPWGTGGHQFEDRELSWVSYRCIGSRVGTKRHRTGAEVWRTLRHLARGDRYSTGRRGYSLSLEGGKTIFARAIVVATGARYRRLDVPNYRKFEYQGVHYAATAMEAARCVGKEVVVVGGGNSAGQAALHLALSASHVHLLIRGDGLKATMSAYLIQRIASSNRITLHPNSEVVSLEGDTHLRSVTWCNRQTHKARSCQTGNMFVMIGALPNTEWLHGRLELDVNGFVMTAPSEGDGCVFQTSLPGIYAVGDVRAGSVKRVANAVGEGSVVVSYAHRYIAAQKAQEMESQAITA
jgi:thioredoxin reductase (NADPH)